MPETDLSFFTNLCVVSDRVKVANVYVVRKSDSDILVQCTSHEFHFVVQLKSLIDFRLCVVNLTIELR